MTREEKLQKAHQIFDNRNLLTELKWQREYFKKGYVSNQEELFNLWIFDECIKALEQEPKTGHCKDCKWWKDSDGKYRRGCGDESQCPINTHAVYCGEGYCYMFEPQDSEVDEGI